MTFFQFLAVNPPTTPWVASVKQRHLASHVPMAVYIVDVWTEYQLCTIRSFLYRKLSVGKFKLQVSFSLGSFVSDKIFEMHFRFLLHIWVRADCRPISQQICKRNSSNWIRKKTGCDELLRTSWTWLVKTSPNIRLSIKMGNKYLEDISSMKGWSYKKAILNFLSPRFNSSACQISFFFRPHPQFF